MGHRQTAPSRVRSSRRRVGRGDSVLPAVPRVSCGSLSRRRCGFHECTQAEFSWSCVAARLAECVDRCGPRRACRRTVPQCGLAPGALGRAARLSRLRAGHAGRQGRRAGPVPEQRARKNDRRYRRQRLRGRRRQSLPVLRGILVRRWRLDPQQLRLHTRHRTGWTTTSLSPGPGVHGVEAKVFESQISPRSASKISSIRTSQGRQRRRSMQTTSVPSEVLIRR